MRIVQWPLTFIRGAAVTNYHCLSALVRVLNLEYQIMTVEFPVFANRLSRSLSRARYLASGEVRGTFFVRFFVLNLVHGRLCVLNLALEYGRTTKFSSRVVDYCSISHTCPPGVIYHRYDVWDSSINTRVYTAVNVRSQYSCVHTRVYTTAVYTRVRPYLGSVHTAVLKLSHTCVTAVQVLPSDSDAFRIGRKIEFYVRLN